MSLNGARRISSALFLDYVMYSAWCAWWVGYPGPARVIQNVQGQKRWSAKLRLWRFIQAVFYSMCVGLRRGGLFLSAVVPCSGDFQEDVVSVPTVTVCVS